MEEVKEKGKAFGTAVKDCVVSGATSVKDSMANDATAVKDGVVSGATTVKDSVVNGATAMKDTISPPVKDDSIATKVHDGVASMNDKLLGK